MSKIVNFYEVMPKDLLPKSFNPNKADHGFDLPFRACIVAPSGSGKTNFLLNLIHLFSKGKGTFASITIITKHADEPLYNYLKLKSPQIAIKEGLASTPDINKFDKDLNHLIVYDDLVLSKDLSIVENIYIRGRKCGVSCIFISQSYHGIPTIIRKNSNYMIILRLGSGKRELNMVLSEFGMGMTKEQLLAMYEDATSLKFVPLIIHMDQPDRDLKFFKSFREQLKPNDYV
jgi:DNA helicase HerA-like ATPase